MDDYLEAPLSGKNLIPVLLGERTLYVEAVPVGGQGDEEVAGRLLKFDGFTDALSTVAGTVTDAIHAGLAKAKPAKVTVEFGCEVGVETGQLTAILVKGTSKANLKVTLEWKAGGGV